MELIDFDIVSAISVPAENDRPAHCRVDGRIDTEINFELLLPEEWNGRFMMGGGGGYVGTVQRFLTQMYARFWNDLADHASA